jgi:AraC-like DNA-binding protein
VTPVPRGVLKPSCCIILQGGKQVLLLNGGADASAAAYSVGYESPSQLSREYRRLFGAPPMQDVKQLRGQMQNQANIVQETP